MNKYSLVKLMENDGEEDGNFSSGKASYDLVLTPKGTADEVVKAFEDISNYGIYASNIRNTATNKATINKAIEQHFGTPVQRRSKTNTFPIYTKDALNDFIKQFSSKPQLVSYSVKGNTLIFPQKDNPTKDLTKKIIKTVLDKAGIKYKLSEKETI
jgi:hypothetical protein